MQIEKPKATVKSLHKVGKCEFESNYGMVLLEIKKLRGNENYESFVDNRKTGYSRGSAEEAWEILGEYLGIEIVEGVVK